MAWASPEEPAVVCPAKGSSQTASTIVSTAGGVIACASPEDPAVVWPASGSSQTASAISGRAGGVIACASPDDPAVLWPASGSSHTASAIAVKDGGVTPCASPVEPAITWSARASSQTASATAPGRAASNSAVLMVGDEDWENDGSTLVEYINGYRGSPTASVATRLPPLTEHTVGVPRPANLRTALSKVRVMPTKFPEPRSSLPPADTITLYEG